MRIPPHSIGDSGCSLKSAGAYGEDKLRRSMAEGSWQIGAVERFLVASVLAL